MTRRPPARVRAVLGVAGLLALAGCAPSPAELYAPYRERTRWVYATHYSGFGPPYEGRLEVESSPEGQGRVRLDVRILPTPGSASPGGRQRYWLEFAGPEAAPRPPNLAELETLGGRARLEPGLPLPGLAAASGSGGARYVLGRRRLSGRRYAFRWSYLPRPGGAVVVPAGRYSVARADLEYRGDLPGTDANLRLELAPGVGLVRAEWKTTYGTTTVFSLIEVDRSMPGKPSSR